MSPGLRSGAFLWGRDRRPRTADRGRELYLKAFPAPVKGDLHIITLIPRSAVCGPWSSLKKIFSSRYSPNLKIT